MQQYQNQLIAHLSPLRNQLLQHPLYQHINYIESLHTFMEHHVYAVWDFMSLLKSLQLQLTCTSTPWVPVGTAKTRRLINEIVLGEESDVDPKGNPSSHYELYLDAMRSAGASTQSIENFVTALQLAIPWQEAIQVAAVPPAAKQFTTHTLTVIETAKTHELAAAFALGREDLIPDLFTNIVRDLNTDESLAPMLYYLERHIELDGDEHGDLAWEMLHELCGIDAFKWEEAKIAAEAALLARIKLWDGIYAACEAETDQLNLA